MSIEDIIYYVNDDARWPIKLLLWEKTLAQATTIESMNWVFRQPHDIGKLLWHYGNLEQYAPNDEAEIVSLLTISAVSASDVAMAAVSASDVARNAIFGSDLAITAVRGNSMAIGKFACGCAGVDPTLYADIADVAQAASAMSAIAASATAMSAIAASAIARQAIENSNVAWNALNASPLLQTRTGQSLTTAIQNAYGSRCFVVSAGQTWSANSDHYLYIDNLMSGGSFNVGTLTDTYNTYRKVGKFANPLGYHNNYTSLGSNFQVKYIPC